MKVFPNPFNNRATVSCSWKSNANISLKLFDATGKCVQTLVSGKQNAGEYNYTIDGAQLASGVYYISLQQDNCAQEVTKLVLVK